MKHAENIRGFVSEDKVLRRICALERQLLSATSQIEKLKKAKPNLREPKTKQSRKAVHAPPDDALFISSGQLLRRYGNVSRQWLWRRLRSDGSFPRPSTLGEGNTRNRYWRVADLERWERSVSAAKSRTA